MTVADQWLAVAVADLEGARLIWNSVSSALASAQRSTSANGLCAGTLDTSYVPQMQLASMVACKCAHEAVVAAQLYAQSCSRASSAAAGARECPGLDLSSEQAQGEPWGTVWNGVANCLDQNMAIQVQRQVDQAAASVAAAQAAQAASKNCRIYKPELPGEHWRIGMLGTGGDYWTRPHTEDSAQRRANCFYTSMMGLSGPCANCGGCCDCKCVEGNGFPCNCPQPQGPTDKHGRCASCWWVTEGIGVAGGPMDQGLSLNGRRVQGFGLGAGPVSVYGSLNAQQQAWVQAALAAWLVDPATVAWWNVNQSACPSVTQGMVLSTPAALQAVVGCFQAWFNAQQSQGGTITTGGTLDQMTLAALMATTAQATWGAAIGGCPGNCNITPNSGGTTTAPSTTKYWVIGGVAVAFVGGLLYVMGRKRAA
jgi:hypothetical protein